MNTQSQNNYMEDDNRIYYVYIHYRLDNNTPFYVGKGKGNRYLIKTRKNRHWTNIVNKCGFRSEIIFDNLLEQESKHLEIKLIKEIGRADLGLGPLVNMSDGGDGGTSGWVMPLYVRNKIGDANRNPSIETRRAISEGKIGDKNPQFGKDHSGKNNGMFGKVGLTAGEKNGMFGRKWTDQERKIISKRNSGVGNGMYNKNHKEETIQIIKLKAKNRKKIICDFCKQEILPCHYPKHKAKYH